MSLAHIILLFLLTIHQQAFSQYFEDALLIDEIISDAALQSYHSNKYQRTAIHYNLSLPSSLLGVSAEVVRYRVGSLRRYGASFGEFTLPHGIFTHPHVKRLLVIHQNLGNLSSVYNQYVNRNARFRLVSPVLGLLFYKATTLHSSPMANINILVSRSPIIVNFSAFVEAKLVQRPKCVVFQLDGNISVTNEVWDDVCVTWQQGHFALIAEESYDDKDGENATKVNKWKMVVMGVLVGTAGTVFIGLLLIALVSVRRKKMLMAEMERRAYEEEALHLSMVGQVRAPTASGSRTKPVLENAYVPE